MEKLSWILIGLGLLLWARKEWMGEELIQRQHLQPSHRERLQEIDGRLYR